MISGIHVSRDCVHVNQKENRMKKVTGTFLGLIVATGLVTAAQAEVFEPTENLTVHTVFGTDAGAAGAKVLKGGTPYDGGSGGMLLGWPGASWGTVNNARLQMSSRSAGDDGSFTVHQMITPWTEATNWGTTHPVAGVDYNPHPIGLIGHGNGSGAVTAEDETEISHLVNHWAGGGANNGLWLQPLGTTNNPNYPGSTDFEFQFLSRHAVPGSIDGDDTIIETNVGAHSFVPGVIEAISDASIFSDNTDLLNNNGHFANSGGVENDGVHMPLLKWGLGAITMSNPASATLFRVGSAFMKVQSISSTTVGFQVHRLLVPWDENSVTWNQFGAGGPVAGTHYVTASVGSINVDNSDTATELDVTEVLNFWLENPDQNHGFILIPDIQTGTLVTPIVDSHRVFGLDGGVPGDDTWISFSGVTIIPEPSSLALAALGAFGVLGRRRRA